MANSLAKISYDGSKPLKNNAHERYARFRAQALPRIVAFRKAGNIAKNDCNADANSFRLEKKPGVRERIEYLTRQAQDRVAEKRVALEEQLWAVVEADPGAFWETYEVAKTGTDGKLTTDQDIFGTARNAVPVFRPWSPFLTISIPSRWAAMVLGFSQQPR